jgi:hypothetical protein
VWDVETGKPVLGPFSWDDNLKSIRFVLDGNRVLVRADYRALLLDMSTKDLLADLQMKDSKMNTSGTQISASDAHILTWGWLHEQETHD